MAANENPALQHPKRRLHPTATKTQLCRIPCNHDDDGTEPDKRGFIQGVVHDGFWEVPRNVFVDSKADTMWIQGDERIKAFSMRTGENLHTLYAGNYNGGALAVLGGQLVLGSKNGQLLAWDLDKVEPMKERIEVCDALDSEYERLRP